MCQPENTPELFSTQRRPWSIWTADVKTGQGRRGIDDAGPGSVFPSDASATNDVPSATNLLWDQPCGSRVPLGEKAAGASICRPVRCGTARALTVESSRSRTSSSARTHAPGIFRPLRMTPTGCILDGRCRAWFAVRTAQRHESRLSADRPTASFSIAERTATNRCIRSR